ncbi:MAG: alpha/beta hydrolase [Bryobacteraceae bacterium]
MIRREFLQTVTAGVTALPASLPCFGQIPQPTTHTYRTAAGCEMKADVYGAAAGAGKPAVLWIHGGALILGNRRGLVRPFHTGLLQAGFVVVSIDYRLAPETKLPAIVEDVQDAYRWMREKAANFGIDRDRIATAGGSAGGYLTQMTGFCLEPRPRALVSYYGYGDIVGPWYSEPDEFYRRQPLVSREDADKVVGRSAVADPPADNQRGKFYLYCRQNGLWPKEVAGHDPHTDSKWFDRYSPIRNVDAKYPPILLIHGTNDTDVPYSLSKDMDAKLSQAAVKHEFITVAGAGHGLTGAKPEEVAQVADRAVQFVKTHTS